MLGQPNNDLGVLVFGMLPKVTQGNMNLPEHGLATNCSSVLHLHYNA